MEYTLIHDSKEPLFWVIWNPSKKAVGQAYKTKGEAFKEAKKLSVQNIGCRFTVLQSAATYRTPPPVIPDTELTFHS